MNPMHHEKAHRFLQPIKELQIPLQQLSSEPALSLRFRRIESVLPTRTPRTCQSFDCSRTSASPPMHPTATIRHGRCSARASRPSLSPAPLLRFSERPIFV